MKKGFTLSEALITIMIIGVVAALTIPSVLANVQQNEFKTGLKKALNVLNNAIEMNLAMEGDTPYMIKNYDFDCNGDGRVDLMDAVCYQRIRNGTEEGDVTPKLAAFLMRHLNVIKTAYISEGMQVDSGSGNSNFAFYTTDGLRFETPVQYGAQSVRHQLPLYENPEILIGTNGIGIQQQLAAIGDVNNVARCGSYGLSLNPNKTLAPPCMLVVDVNGDKKPNPTKINARGEKYRDDYAHDKYITSDPLGKRLKDVFVIMITEKSALPYGIAAQRAMYELDDRK